MENTVIENLPDEFIGTREVSGFKFRKIFTRPKSYVFEVTFGENHHYEAIKRITVPKCLDFEKRIYSETEFKETYPTAKMFGKTGFSYARVDDAIEKAMGIDGTEQLAEMGIFGTTQNTEECE